MGKLFSKKRSHKNATRVIMAAFDMRNAFYEAGDPRRRLERLDSQLIGNDHTEIQNVPQQSKIRYFPGRPWGEE